jgi:hypothetical protein
MKQSATGIQVQWLSKESTLGRDIAALLKSNGGIVRVPVTIGNGTDDHGSQHF